MRFLRSPQSISDAGQLDDRKHELERFLNVTDAVAGFEENVRQHSTDRIGILGVVGRRVQCRRVSGAQKREFVGESMGDAEKNC